MDTSHAVHPTSPHGRQFQAYSSFTPSSAFHPSQLAFSEVRNGSVFTDPSLSRQAPTPSHGHQQFSASSSSHLQASARRTRGTMEPPIAELSQIDAIGLPATVAAAPHSHPAAAARTPMLENRSAFQRDAHPIPFGGEVAPTPARAHASTLNPDLFTTPGQVDPFNTQRNAITSENLAQLPDTSVTVFGFPSEMASSILADFQKCGYIIRYQVEPQSNWMHIQYEDSRQAKQALGADGLVLGLSGRQVMLGVRPCIDKPFLDATQPNDASSAILGSEVLKKTQARSLTVRTKPVADPTSVLATPKREPTYVEMAKDLIFGW
eukprot:m.114983 g.114983  ORF g.114983 m.114983 type:complete len:321 (-) comp51908_c0_seq6:524-1486(-)